MSERICTSCTLVRSVAPQSHRPAIPDFIAHSDTKAKEPFLQMPEIPIVGKQPHPACPKES